MWRRIYLLLVAVRLYFALQPSYIHPDEHFQGPEIISGRDISCDHRTINALMLHPQARSLAGQHTKLGSSHPIIQPAVSFLYGLRTAFP